MSQVRYEEGQEEDVRDRFEQGGVQFMRNHLVMLFEGLLLRVRSIKPGQGLSKKVFQHDGFRTLGSYRDDGGLHAELFLDIGQV